MSNRTSRLAASSLAVAVVVSSLPSASTQDVGAQGTSADSATFRLASLGIDPVPFLEAVAALRPADCAAGSALSFSAGVGPLGEVLAFTGAEAISAPFRFVVAVRSPSPPDPAALVGSTAQLNITVGRASTEVSGILTDVRVGASPQGEGVLVVTLEPQLAHLARDSGFSIHQNFETPELLADLLQDAGIAFERRLFGDYPPHEFQARYGETLLAFTSRLMEQEGIHYHSEGNTAVLGDTNSSFPPTGPALTYSGDGGPGTLERFARGRGLVPTRATVRGFNFLRPFQVIQGSSTGSPGGGETYVFSSAITTIPAAQQDASRRLESTTWEGQRHAGASRVPTPRAGHVVNVAALQGGLGGAYLVTAARHVGLRDAQGKCFSFGNEFEAIPSTTTFRPRRTTPVPSVGGALSAVVTGPPGSKLYRDVNGRVKVQFRFDREGKSDENSSAWIRVAVPPGRTAELFVPRVGSEVLVAFFEGDPSQPVVIASLNNANDPPPRP